MCWIQQYRVSPFYQKHSLWRKMSEMGICKQIMRLVLFEGQKFLDHEAKMEWTRESDIQDMGGTWNTCIRTFSVQGNLHVPLRMQLTMHCVCYQWIILCSHQVNKVNLCLSESWAKSLSQFDRFDIDRQSMRPTWIWSYLCKQKWQTNTQCEIQRIKGKLQSSSKNCIQ